MTTSILLGLGVFVISFIAKIIYFSDSSITKKIAICFHILSIIIILYELLYNTYLGIVCLSLYIITFFFLEEISANIYSVIFRRMNGFDGKFVGFPNKELYKLSRIIWNISTNVNDIINIHNTPQPHFFIYKYCSENKQTNELLDYHSIDIDEFKLLYGNLLLNGALQYRMNHLIAVSALCYPETLNYIILHKIDKYVVFDLIMYFSYGIHLGSIKYE